MHQNKRNQLTNKQREMNKKFLKSMKHLLAGIIILSTGIAMTGCDDNIDLENRFTFTGELIADHLQNNPDKFSHFVEILNKAKIGKKTSGSILKTLSTYGSYTCFAPTNDAVEKFIKELYDKHIESVEANKTDPTSPIINTGVKSLDISLLSDSMATEIAKNHIIEMGYRTIDVNEGSFPQVTMNRRSTHITWPKNEDGPVYALLNNSARIIEQDIKTENGYIQVIDAVLNPSNKSLPDQVASHKSFSLFSEAIFATGLDKLLRTYEIDPDYDGMQFGLKFETEAGLSPFPEEKHQKYTLLVESNDLLADPSKNALNISITTLDQLVKYAEHWYGTEAQDDRTNPKNALYKYVAYHIIDRQLQYSSGTGSGGFLMENYDCKGFKSEVNLPTTFDRYDYFETMLPYTMIKVTKPFTNDELRQEIVINYAQEKGTAYVNEEMKHHINVIVERASTTVERPGLEEFDQEALNGIIHTIDRILIYNENEMVGNVLNERMRWDSSSLFPEFTNNGVRWMTSLDGNNTTYIPQGYSSRLVINNTDTHVYYLRPHSTSLGGYASFMGDELLVTGKYDFQYRLPYVPEGDYEIRFGFSQSDARGVCQFYLDKKICGIPVDMRNTKENQTIIGWFDEHADGQEMSEEEIRANDKAMRNRGFMKAPASCHLTDKKESMRDSELAIRKIIGTFRLTANDHWLRFKDVTENSTGKLNQFNQDYLEIVPTRIINDPTKPEDQY